MKESLINDICERSLECLELKNTPTVPPKVMNMNCQYHRVILKYDMTMMEYKLLLGPNACLASLPTQLILYFL